MELYGRRLDTETVVDSDNPQGLSEISFVLTADEMQRMEAFFRYCSKNSGDYDHIHLSDFLQEDEFAGPDVVVCFRRE